MARPLRGGGRGKGFATKKKDRFLKLKKKLEKKFWQLSSRGGGKALVDGPLKKYRFFAASLTQFVNNSHRSYTEYINSLECKNAFIS